MSARRWLLLALFLVAGAARGFVSKVDPNGRVMHWDLVNVPNTVHTNVVNPATKAVRFFIAVDAFSTTNTAAELNAVRACFAQWQAIPGTHLKFEDAGLIGPGVDVNTSDHTNVVFWAKQSTLVNGGTVDIFGALGVTFSSPPPDDVMLEADIVLNGVPGGAGFEGSDPISANWFTDFTATQNTNFFVEGTLLHEIGHFIGLDHSPVGGATMLGVGERGVGSTQVGLSTDEMSAARAVYPAAPASFSNVRGLVTNLNGTAVLGAAVMAENLAGNLVAGSVTRDNGVYELPALPPGNYRIRVTPLDSLSGRFQLISGRDIGNEFAGAETDFLPPTNQLVTLQAGLTNTANFAVTNSPPPFYISHILSTDLRPTNVPRSIRPGQTGQIIGVWGPDLPTGGAVLSIAGDGVSLGATTFTTDVGNSLNLVYATINVASNATPGLRSLVVTRTADGARAHANGFLEILPPFPDSNFDGLDDLYQRQYFPLFTAAQAAPTADPDGDGYNNLAEYIAGSIPTNSNSFLQIQSVIQNTGGTTITWNSAPGKKYLILSRPQIATAPWTTNATIVTASAVTAQFTDAPAVDSVKFYRVQAVP